MQVMGLVNQLSNYNFAAGVRRTNRYTQTDTTSFNKTLQQRQINQVKQEIYEKFQISVGSYGKSFSCYIPANVLYQIGCNPSMKEKVYEQLESYSPENYQASIAGLNPPVKRCTLIFDEGGDATATLEAATSEDDLMKYSSANAILNYRRGQTAALPYSLAAYGGNSLNSMYGMSSVGNLGYNLGSLYGFYSPYTSSYYGNNSGRNTNSLLASVVSRISSRI